MAALRSNGGKEVDWRDVKEARRVYTRPGKTTLCNGFSSVVELTLLNPEVIGTNHLGCFWFPLYSLARLNTRNTTMQEDFLITQIQELQVAKHFQTSSRLG